MSFTILYHSYSVTATNCGIVSYFDTIAPSLNSALDEQCGKRSQAKQDLRVCGQCEVKAVCCVSRNEINANRSEYRHNAAATQEGSKCSGAATVWGV
jgi:hypothetical protein